MERHYGWVIVAIGALMGCVGMGSMFSLAVFLDPMVTETGWSRAGGSVRPRAKTTASSNFCDGPAGEGGHLPTPAPADT
jgi:Na+-transporting NADH:ubiquinone oxidoreductase subunit NqrD